MLKRFFKRLIYIVWTFGPKDYWKGLWSKTTVDEKAIATVKEVKKRFKLTADELADVGRAIQEVGNQLSHVPKAAAGKTKRRPSKKTVKK